MDHGLAGIRPGRAVSERRGAALVSQQCAMCHAVGRFDESIERAICDPFKSLEHAQGTV
jgi:hypothetical protein